MSPFQNTFFLRKCQFFRKKTLLLAKWIFFALVHVPEASGQSQVWHQNVFEFSQTQFKPNPEQFSLPLNHQSNIVHFFRRHIAEQQDSSRSSIIKVSPQQKYFGTQMFSDVLFKVLCRSTNETVTLRTKNKVENFYKN